MKNTASRRHSRTTFRPRLESLETRLTPTTYTVSSLADSGAGSLRAAITSVNADTTADVIDFSVAGVIQLTSGALPSLTNAVTIDGTTAPGFTNAPVVEIDNNGFAGLTLTATSSSIKSLSIVKANGAGVTLQGSGTGFSVTGADMNIVGNFIGLAPDGSVAPNTGAGLVVDDSRFDTIGGGTSVDRNVISGNGGDGIHLGPSGQLGLDTFIINNFIGTDPSGQSAAGNQGNGITILAGGNNIGSFSGYGNTIAFNNQSGVLVNGGPFNPIQSNSIFSNAGPGIQLINNGNQGQIAPQLSYAAEEPSYSTPGAIDVRVGGTLNGQPNLAFTVQVFATLNSVPAGQGQLFLGWVQVTPNAYGFATFTLNASVPGGAGATFTATAADTSSDYNSFSNTSEFSNSIGASTANQVYVANVYQLLLNRVADASSSVWVNDLNNGVSAAGVVLGIENSTEYLNDQVSALYNRYLGRSPDPPSEQSWTNFLLAGGTLEEVAEGLAASQEYFVLHGSTNQGFITGLYGEVLYRSPSTAESAGWETALDAGVSRAQVAVAFLTSQEYRTDLVQVDYMTFLLRSADSGGVTAWVDALNAGATDQEVLAGIFGSPEGYQLWS